MRKIASPTLLAAILIVACCADAAQAAPGERTAWLLNGSNPASWLAFRSDIAAGPQPAVLNVGFAALSLQTLEGNWPVTDTHARDLNVPVAPVPESGAMVLLGSAFFGLAYAIKRRASRK
jgi:hypothetical protein